MEMGHDHGSSALQVVEALCSQSSKTCIKQHGTEETRYSRKGDEVSETESWADGSSLLGGLSNCTSTRHPSRRSHTGRRAKAEARQEEFAGSRAGRPGNAEASDFGLWSHSMTALLESPHGDIDTDRGDFFGSAEAPSAARSETSRCSSAEAASSDARGDVRPCYDAEARCMDVDLDATPSKFTVKVIRPKGASLGLSIQQHGQGLLITHVLSGGVVELWNWKCLDAHKVTQIDKS